MNGRCERMGSRSGLSPNRQAVMGHLLAQNLHSGALPLKHFNLFGLTSQPIHDDCNPSQPVVQFSSLSERKPDKLLGAP